MGVFTVCVRVSRAGLGRVSGVPVFDMLRLNACAGIAVIVLVRWYWHNSACMHRDGDDMLVLLCCRCHVRVAMVALSQGYMSVLGFCVAQPG